MMDNLEEIVLFLESAPTESTAFQSILVNSLQLLDAVHTQEVLANEAAISLGQQVKVEQMITTIESLQRVLRQALNKQGHQILLLQNKTTFNNLSEPCNSWWDCVAETLETLTIGIDCIGSFVKGQPKESPVQTLGALINSLLMNQYKEFSAEIDEQLAQ